MVTTHRYHAVLLSNILCPWILCGFSDSFSYWELCRCFYWIVRLAVHLVGTAESSATVGKGGRPFLGTAESSATADGLVEFGR